MQYWVELFVKWIFSSYKSTVFIINYYRKGVNEQNVKQKKLQRRKKNDTSLFAGWLAIVGNIIIKWEKALNYLSICTVSARVPIPMLTKKEREEAQKTIRGS